MSVPQFRHFIEAIQGADIWPERHLRREAPAAATA